MENNKSRIDHYDDECTKLEMAVKQGQMSIGGAIARAMILGMNYQAEVSHETAENEASHPIRRPSDDLCWATGITSRIVTSTAQAKCSAVRPRGEITMNTDFSPVCLMIGNILKKRGTAPYASPSRSVEYAQVALCAAQDEGLITKSEANSISKQFGLGLKWEE